MFDHLEWFVHDEFRVAGHSGAFGESRHPEGDAFHGPCLHGDASIVDGPVRGGHDFRKGRAAAQIQFPKQRMPRSQSRARCGTQRKVRLVFLSVPTIVGSISDITFLAKRKTSVEEINQILTDVAASPRWQGILKVTTDQWCRRTSSASHMAQPFR